MYLTSFIKVVKMFGVGEEFGCIDVSDIRCTTQLPPTRMVLDDPGWRWWHRGLQSVKRFIDTAQDRMSTLEIHSAIVANSHVSFNHVACISLASGMASIGLLTDSNSFVLAAFFVSPLMQMFLTSPTWSLEPLAASSTAWLSDS
ncbi:unnamed protein product [Polarella glacialis]|uniref:Uncharacterized protein n=1 Tax=Polarella glacialis TaxID=89957 RepID=A0A813F7S6_POLGL|nr:unnamed protein product [Polarella glacialis]